MLVNVIVSITFDKRNVKFCRLDITTGKFNYMAYFILSQHCCSKFKPCVGVV